jgi:hypothetical protein
VEKFIKRKEIKRIGPSLPRREEEIGASHRPLQEAAQAATEWASQLAPLQTKQKVQKPERKTRFLMSAMTLQKSHYFYYFLLGKFQLAR